jgi:hypothetical protein
MIDRKGAYMLAVEFWTALGLQWRLTKANNPQ